MSHLHEHFRTGSPVAEVIVFPVIGGVEGSLKLGTQVTVEQPFRARPFGLWLRPTAAGTPWPSRTPPVFLLFRGTQWHGMLRDQGFPFKDLLSCQHNTGRIPGHFSRQDLNGKKVSRKTGARPALVTAF